MSLILAGLPAHTTSQDRSEGAGERAEGLCASEAAILLRKKDAHAKPVLLKPQSKVVS